MTLIANPTFAGRGWKMVHIVNHVARGRPSTKQLRERYRKGVRRVIDALVELNKVRVVPGRYGKSPALIYWIQVGHPVDEILDGQCDNSDGEVATAAFTTSE
ncbi:MAG: hypothetical protein AB7K24_21010 [Gemmataceae bacterium]